ncbi:Sec-independent protein translocase protein TatB [Corallincola platygyrae]|uniref:Sec-independent protein translocase protein TatB n=1 Tax=Corallincola platygyrae TaxID=1193278 RepID=A0ABW4XM25_9GAMM
MFDIGFWELIIIAVVGLVVLGPERLPGAVRSVTRTIGTIKRYGGAVRQQVEQELQIEQLHQDLKKAEQMGTKVTPELQASLNKLRARAESVNRPYGKDEGESPVSEDASSSLSQSTDEASQSQSSELPGNTSDAPAKDKNPE